jgi:signal transduction histidine kinase
MVPQEADPDVPAGNIHRLARLLRHEVGDLLQSVYSTVGILVERLPAGLALERRLVSDLKSRAELCKVELDAVVELAGPLNLTPARVDLRAMVQVALMQLRRRFPDLPIHFDGAAPVWVMTDARALTGSLSLLFLALCQSAKREFAVRVGQDGQKAECSLQRDGYAVTEEQLSWLTQPFATTQHALFGLGLATAQRVVRSGGGEVEAANRQEGGVKVRILFPVARDG